MKKKVVSALLVSVMVMGLAAGCGSSGDGDGGSGSDGGDGGEITYWSMWTNAEPQGKVIQEAADAYEEETGVHVNIEWKGRDVKNILGSALEAEENIDLFDDGYERITENYVDYLADLTEMADAAGYADKSYALFNDVVTNKTGFLCCVTEQPQVGGVFYNKDLFEDAGITETPATWEDFLAASQALVDAGYQPLALDSTYAPFLFGYHLARHIGEEEVANLTTNGGWSQNAGAVQAAQEMVDYVKAGYLADGAPDEYPASQNKIGIDQNVAMVVCANYVTSEVNNTAGEELNWGLFNYPSVEGGVDATSAYAGANSLAIPKYSENQQEAFDFAMFLVTGEYDQKMADEAGQIPADPSNTAPASQSGTTEVLNNTTDVLSWNMGLDSNAEKVATIQEVIVQMYEGAYASGEEVMAAMDALY